MDSSILSKNGIVPSNQRKGCLDNYRLVIGNRASLVRSNGEKSYGIVMSVEETAINKLYSEPSVADYVPEEVSIVIDTGETVAAYCYNLPTDLLTGTNTAYAHSLFQLAKRNEFPQDYLEEIRKMAQD